MTSTDSGHHGTRPAQTGEPGDQEVTNQDGQVAQHNPNKLANSRNAKELGIRHAHRTRARQLPRVVNNSRLLILPWVRVKILASTILSRTARALVTDWWRAYGVAPVLLETLVDPARFDGASYRAANWIVVGTTSGRGRNDRARHAVRTPKRVLLYPLVRDAALQLREH